jgi:hypothetical protein
MAVGVPVIAPVVVLSVRPAGRVDPGASEKVRGAVPPVTVIGGLLKGTPTSPALVAGQVSVGGLMVKGQLLAETSPFVSVTLREKLPGARGVPVIAPVVVLRDRPAGSVPTTEKVKGAVPPVMPGAGLLNATPTVPVVTGEQVSAGGIT